MRVCISAADGKRSRLQGRSEESETWIREMQTTQFGREVHTLHFLSYALRTQTKTELGRRYFVTAFPQI